VIHFVEEQLAIPRKRIRLEARLHHDLGLDGDDAAEFMEAFGKHFGVDLAAFRFDAHFGAEGYDPFEGVHSLISNRARFRLEPITVADLITAAMRRSWPNDRQED
jgi:acyl carrier protein